MTMSPAEFQPAEAYTLDLPRSLRPIVVLGAGGIVEDAIRPADRKANFPVFGICNRTAASAKALADEFGIERVFASVTDAVVAAPADVSDLTQPQPQPHPHPLKRDIANTRSNMILRYEGRPLRVVISANHDHEFGPKNEVSFIKWEGTRGAIRAQMGLLLDYPTGGEDRLDYQLLVEEDEGWQALVFDGSWFPDAVIASMGALQRFIEGTVAKLPTSVDRSFMKTIGGPFDRALMPRASAKTNWKVELGIVIGRTARYLNSPEDADVHIAGYVLSHDVSEREFQLERGGQWDKGKSCETFNPPGPELVAADEGGDPQSLGLRLWVNGILRQDGTTANMIFGIRHLVWCLSQFMVLSPGDLINTGTPAGVALGLPGNPYLRAGDVVELEIDGLGRARQEMVQA